MFELIKNLYESGEIDITKLQKAVLRKLITQEEYMMIVENKD